MSIQLFSNRKDAATSAFRRRRSGVRFRHLWSPRLLALLFAALLAWSAPARATRWVADDSGHKVAVPDHPHRVLCLAPSIADTVFALGAGDEVAAVTDYTSYPPEARRKPSIGQPIRPSLERIAVLHPDLVIGISTFNDAETIRGIRRLGIPVFLVNPAGLEGLYRSIGEIGDALNRTSAAEALVGLLRVRINNVRQQASAFPRAKIFIALSLDPCISAGGGAFLTELLRAAGADSVTAELPQPWVQLSIEAVLPRRPDFILAFRDAPIGLEQMRQRPGWRSLEAVRAGRILRIDERLQYPSPSAFDALEAFARQLRAAQVGRTRTLHGERP
jgi:iron complex transport system substrate-binding protein